MSTSRVLRHLSWLVLCLQLLQVSAQKNEWNFHSTISTCKEHHCLAGNVSDSLGSRTCRCDPGCSHFSDCCYDSSHFQLLRLGSTDESFRCVKSSPTSSFFMKSNCPNDWTETRTRDRCRNPSWSDPLLALPVTSIDSKITYNNAFCAICNKETNFKVWDVKLFYDEYLYSENSLTNEFISENLYYNKNISAWGVDAENGFFEVELSAKVPEDVKNSVRECVSDIIDKCNIRSSVDEQNLCEIYTYVVYDEAGNGYKNPHCAECNGVPLSNLTCSITKDRDGIWETTIPLSMIISMSSKTLNEDEVFDVFTKRYRRWDQEIAAIKENLTPTQRSYDTDPKSDCEIAKQKYEDHVQINGVNLEKLYQGFDTFAYGNIMVINDGEIVSCVDNLAAIDSSQFSKGEKIISFIGYDLSIVFLFIHLSFYLTSPDRNKMPQMNTASLSIALLMSYIALLVGNSFEGEFCYGVALILTYSLLASFIWMFIIAYDIWNMLKTTDEYLQAYVGSILVRFSIYSFIGWLFPAFIVLFAFMADNSEMLPVDWRPAYGRYSCWFGRPKALMVFFVVPFIVTMFFNMIFFTLSGRIVYTIRSAVHTCRKQTYKVYLKMAVTMGLTWAVGLAAVACDNVVLRYIFVILNSFQGVYICITHTFAHLQRSESTLFNRLSSKLRLSSWPSFTRQKSYEMPPHEAVPGKVEFHV